jgi:ferredoxin-NADP reductase
MAEKIARVTALREIAPSIIVLDAQMVEPATMEFKAGQFVSIRIDEKGDVRRSYTMTSPSSRNDGFELLVKMVPGGAASGHFGRMRPGDELRFTGPMGFFFVDAGHPGDSVFVATGAGIAAALPMALETPRKAKVLWSMRRDDEYYWTDRLAGLDWEKVVPPSAEWPEAHALLAERCAALLGSLRDPMFYLVGNGDMTRAVRDHLIALGVDRRKRIKNEIFYPVSEP